MITSVDAEAAPGVAPYIRDRRLLASLPVAVRLTLDDYPQVREAPRATGSGRWPACGSARPSRRPMRPPSRWRPCNSPAPMRLPRPISGSATGPWPAAGSSGRLPSIAGPWR